MIDLQSSTFRWAVGIRTDESEGEEFRKREIRDTKYSNIFNKFYLKGRK